MTHPRLTLVALAIAAALAITARADEPKWKQHTINSRSEFEAAGVFDVDNDGQLDIVSGDTWYQGPTWKPYHVRDVARVGTYYHDFATLPLDVNGDGKTDFVTCSYFGKEVGWVENPGKPGAIWTYHKVDQPGNIEAAWAVDLTGDGIPDILPNSVNTIAWYEVVPKSGGAGHELKKHDLGTAAAGHGVGSGDVNGDGRVDLLTPKGWFECCRTRRTSPGPGIPTGTSAPPASRSWRRTWTVTGSPTSSGAWATITGYSGSSKERAPAANAPGDPGRRSTRRSPRYTP